MGKPIKKVKGVVLRSRQTKAGKSLYLDIHSEHGRTRETLNLYLVGHKQKDKETLRLAEAIQHERAAEIRKHLYSPSYVDNRFKSFREYSFENVDGESAIRQMRASLRIFEGLFGELRLGQLTEKVYDKYCKHVSSLDQLSENTKHLYILRVHLILVQAHKEGLVNFLPEKKVKRARSNVKVVYLTVEELRILDKHLIHCEGKERETLRTFLFCCFTGLRISDAIKLEMSDIKDGIISFEQKKTKQRVSFPLPAQARKYLEPNEGLLFKPPSTSWGNSLLKRIATKTNIDKNLSFHVARHTFAVTLVTSGARILAVKDLLGHASVTTTQVYAKVVESVKRETIDLLPEL